MAGFFGLFDYTRPGKGVSKDEAPKNRFAHFFELFFRKFWKLIQLNLLYLVCCLPVVTIGPATAGLVYVLRNFANEQPVFLVSDFWDAFRENWKSSFIYSLLLGLVSAVLYVALLFYLSNLADYTWMYLPAGLCVLGGLMAVVMDFYVMPMIVTLDLPLRSIVKNASILAIVRLKTNAITLVVLAALLFLALMYPMVSVLLVPFLLPALLRFIVVYNSYPGIQQYVIDPFLAQQKEGDGGFGPAGDEHPPVPDK